MFICEETPVMYSIEQLEQRKVELEQRIEAIKADFAQGLEADSEERAVQLQNTEVLNALMRLALNELSKVNERLSTLS